MAYYIEQDGKTVIEYDSVVAMDQAKLDPSRLFAVHPDTNKYMYQHSETGRYMFDNGTTQKEF